MNDIVDVATRSRMMSGIKGRNTSPEILIRKAMHARGYRFRLHVKGLPGKPDLVLPKFKSVIFVHGCFWHGHSCRYFKMPNTRHEFWSDKITNNQKRDEAQVLELMALGWRVLIIWECAIRFIKKHQTSALIDQVSSWLASGDLHLEIDEKSLIKKLGES